MSCIKSRYKFSQLSFDDSRNFINSYFEKIRDSYSSIVENHFRKLKNFLFPWNLFDNVSEKISLEAKYNSETAAISFRFIPNHNDDSIKIDYMEGMPRITPVGKGSTKSIPVMSMRSNDGWHFYDLISTGHGIDSAREIALDVVTTQISSLLDKGFLPIGDTPVITGEYIENILKNINLHRNRVKDFESIPKLSIYVNSIDEIIDELTPFRNIVGVNGSFINPFDFNIQFTYMLLIDIKKKGINQSEYLLPKKDLNISDIENKKSYYVWELFSKEQLVKRIQKYYDLFQLSYRNKIDSCFPTLKNDFKLYKIGPVKYYIDLVIKNKSRFHSTVVTKWEPVKESEEISTVVNYYESEYEEPPFSREYFYEMQRKLRKLGRDIASIPGISHSILDRFFDSNIITSHVYKEIKDEFDSIFK